MIKRASMKIKEQKQRDPEILEAEYDTYCVTSVYILQIGRIQMILCLALSICTVILLVMPDVKVLTFQRLLLYMYRPVVYASYFWFLQVYLFISIEYYIMRQLILFEWNKSVDEITFLYQNTLEFRKSEQ